MSTLANRWRALAVVVLVAIGLSCGDNGTGPDSALSIEFENTELPSLVLGDQLRDTLGNVDSLRAIAFNSSGDTIQNAAIRYVHADTSHIVTIDSITGHVTANDTGFARVVAQTSNLQSPPETLFVVQRPDAFSNVTALNDTLTFTPVRADTLFPLSVVLKSGGNAVNHYRVEYSFIYPPNFSGSDSTQLLLTDEAKRFSVVDTTGTGTSANTGAATRYLRITPFTHFTTDTVVVEARAFLPDHTPVPGSPVHFKVLVQIQ